MLKKLLKITDAYKSVPHEVSGFTMDKIGSSWYVYAHFDDRESVAVGRYKTEKEARAAFETLKNLTDKNRE